MEHIFEDQVLYRPAEIIKPLGPLPMSRSAMWLAFKDRGVKPMRLGPRTTAFRGRDLNRFVASFNEGGDDAEAS